MGETDNRDDPAVARTITDSSPPPDDGAPPLARGESFGRYLVLDRLGAGGMGVVYSAYDPDLDRKVAVKQLRLEVGADSSRLLREARAMARLQHPNVIAVYDVGTVAGRVFVAMELVEGTTLSGWLEERPRSWREILAMYGEAGRGLAAAHAVGLVHRDFKPSNVLVGRDGRVRVVDFGLARARDGAGDGDEPEGPSSSPSSPSLDEPLTRTGVLIGTPTYMSPEQLLHEPTDARSDQFSFCVALYRALFAERPFAGDEFSTLVAEVTGGRVRVPPKSSTVPTWVRAAVLRGLERDPARRWPSLEALLTVLDRDPARQRRRWLAAAGATITAVAVVVGAGIVHRRQTMVCRGAERKLAGVWDDAVKRKVHDAFAATGKPYAEDVFRGVSRALDAYLGSWTAMRTDACEATRLRREQSEQVLDLRMECLDERLENVRANVELFRGADGPVVANAVQMASSIPSLSTCADAAALSAPVRPPADPQTRARVDDMRRRLARAGALSKAGKLKAAEAAATPIVAEARALGYRPLEAQTLRLLGNTQARFSDPAAPHTLEDAALAARAGRDALTEAWAYANLVHNSYDRSAYPEAHQWARRAEAVLESLGSQGDLPLAEYLIAYSAVLADENKFDEALADARRSIAIREQRFGRDSVDVAFAVEATTRVLGQMGRFAEGEAMLQRSLPILERELGPNHPSVANTLVQVGFMLDGQGRYEEARRAIERAVAIREQVFGPNAGVLAGVLDNLGSILVELERYDEADKTLRRALAIGEKVYGPDNPHTALTMTNLGDLYRLQGKYDEAEAWCQRTIPAFERAFGQSHTFLAAAVSCVAQTEVDRKRPARALPWLERAKKIWDAHPGGDPNAYAVDFALARALWDTSGDRARARALALRARERFAATGAKGAPHVREIDAWLAAHAPEDRRTPPAAR